MSFHIENKQTGDVAVLRCVGKMVRAAALRLLKDAVTGMSQLRVIVLDLSDVTMVGARGLGTLVSLHNWAGANGIQLKLVNPSKVMREMLELTGLTSVLQVSSLDEVIQIFCNSDRAIESAERAVA